MYCTNNTACWSLTKKSQCVHQNTIGQSSIHINVSVVKHTLAWIRFCINIGICSLWLKCYTSHPWIWFKSIVSSTVYQSLKNCPTSQKKTILGLSLKTKEILHYTRIICYFRIDWWSFSALCLLCPLPSE